MLRIVHQGEKIDNAGPGVRIYREEGEGPCHPRGEDGHVSGHCWSQDGGRCHVDQEDDQVDHGRG